MKIKMRSGTVSINGTPYKGDVITILNGEIIVDGKIHGDILGFNEISIVVNGDVETLKTEGGDVEVHGDVGTVKTASGDVYCDNVNGYVESMSGDIHCKKVIGGVKTLSGNVYKSQV